MARRTEFRDSRRSILIVTEGLTEYTYFSQLRSEWRLPDIAIHVKKKESQNSPMGIVNYAEKENRRKDFDYTWCIFDRDTTKNSSRLYEKVVQKAGQNKYDIADSFPCFELWLLMHFDFTTRQFENCKKVERALQNFISDYSKRLEYLKRKNIFQFLLPQLPSALENCEKLKNYNRKNNVTDGSVSNVHKLIIQIGTLGGIDWIKSAWGPPSE